MKLSVKGFKEKASGFFKNSVRVLRLAKKPTKQELFTVAKITGLGIILIGLVGYVIESLKWLLAG